jgi:hypothetical protein
MSILPAVPAAAGREHRRSPFAGADVCEHAGFALPPGTRPVMFDDDVWDFTQVTGLPVQLPASTRRLDFTAIGTASWRLAGKELMFALLVPRHPAVCRARCAPRCTCRPATAACVRRPGCWTG